MEYIKLNNCKKGFIYKLGSRNLNLGVFNRDEFVGIREKFGCEYLFPEYHCEVASCGTAYPVQELCQLPSNILPIMDIGLFAIDPADSVEKQVSRRDLADGEEPHGKRQGFVDEWMDSKKRLPEKLFPYLKENKLLFDFLKKLEKA